MTTSPDPKSPVSASPTSTETSAPVPVPAAGFDEGTFQKIPEPRSENRLPLGDGAWHQISPKYVVGQLIGYVATLVLIAAVVLVVRFVSEENWPLIPGAIAFVFFLLLAIITPRQARSIGYQLREDDLVFRRGILWQRMVAVPYGRLQLVDITHGPLDRGLGIAQLKLVTAAASTGVTIPGLPQQTAEQLRDALIEVAETRRTGL
ncbi:PH domain-containing protein [Microbacterium sp.]|uniref:PH domain-containing protein n=1 Tax=Microbacterium sp. TaxID=51671 RepID=UPI003735A67D